MSTLEKSRQAKEVELLLERIKALELTHASHQNQLSTQLSVTRRAYQDLVGEHEDLKRRFNSVSASNSSIAARVSELETVNADATSRLRAAVDEGEWSHASDVDRLQKELQDAMEIGSRQSTQAEAALKDRDSKLTAKHAVIETLKLELRNTEAAHSVEVQRLSQQLLELERARAVSSGQLVMAKRDAQVESSHHSSAIETLFSQIENLNAIVGDRESQLDSAKADLAGMASAAEANATHMEQERSMHTTEMTRMADVRESDMRDHAKRLNEISKQVEVNNRKRKVLSAMQAELLRREMAQLRAAGEVESVRLADALTALEAASRELATLRAAASAQVAPDDSGENRISPSMPPLSPHRGVCVIPDPLANGACVSGRDSPNELDEIVKVVKFRELEISKLHAQVVEQVALKMAEIQRLSDVLTFVSEDVIGWRRCMFVMRKEFTNRLRVQQEGYNHLLRDMTEMRSEFESEKMAMVDATVAQNNAQLRQAQMHDATLRTKLREAAASIASLHEKWEKECMHREDWNRRTIIIVDQRGSDHHRLVSAMEATVVELTGRIKSYETGIENVCERNLDLQEALEAERATSAQLRTDLTTRTSQYESESFRATREFNYKTDALSAKLTLAEKDLVSVKAERDALQARVTELAEKLALTDAGSEGSINSLQSQILLLNKSLEAARSELREKNFEIADFKREFAGAMKKQHEGYAELLVENERMRENVLEVNRKWSIESESLRDQIDAKVVEVGALKAKVVVAEKRAVELEAECVRLRAANNSPRGKQVELSGVVVEDTEVEGALRLEIQRLKEEQACRVHELMLVIGEHEKREAAAVERESVVEEETRRLRSELTIAWNRVKEVSTANDDVGPSLRLKTQECADLRTALARAQQDLLGVSGRLEASELFASQLQGELASVGQVEEAIVQKSIDVDAIVRSAEFRENSLRNEVAVAITRHERAMCELETQWRKSAEDADRVSREAVDRLTTELELAGSEVRCVKQANAVLIADLESAAAVEHHLRNRLSEFESIIRTQRSQIETIANELA